MLRQLGPRRPTAYFSLRGKERTQRSPACGPATSPSGRWPISASLEGPSQAHRTNSAPLEGSGSTLRRVTHLRLARGLPSGPSTAQSHFRLARGQRTCPRAGGQSPPRSRTADLPSSGWPISASLEDSGPALERVANLRLARGHLSAQETNGPAAQPTAVRRH
jgi:hypothetical protein